MSSSCFWLTGFPGWQGALGAHEYSHVTEVALMHCPSHSTKGASGAHRGMPSRQQLITSQRAWDIALVTKCFFSLNNHFWETLWKNMPFIEKHPIQTSWIGISCEIILRKSVNVGTEFVIMAGSLIFSRDLVKLNGWHENFRVYTWSSIT